MDSKTVIMTLRPHSHWGIVTAGLRQVSSLGRYMSADRAVRSEYLDDNSEGLRSLARLCEDMQPAALYARYASKTVFRREKDFWETAEEAVRLHVKRMADMQLLEALRQAEVLDIPVLHAPTAQSPLHIDDRLHLDENTQVTPVMCFHRHDGGITYRLQLRLGGGPAVTLADHRLAVLGHQPGTFILDNDILTLDESFSAKLLLPFVNKEAVEIPRRMEEDYFRRFILKNVTKAEVVAEGFDIEDTVYDAIPQLRLEHSINGGYLLSLHFLYGDSDYTPDSKSNGRVKLLSDSCGGFRFVRVMRDRKREQAFMADIKDMAHITQQGFITFATLSDIIEWLRGHGSLLRRKGFDVVQPSEHVYHIGPMSVEQSDTWNGDWLQTAVTIVLDDGRLRIPFMQLRDTILRGEREYMLPTGERLLIPDEWLKRYNALLLLGRADGDTFIRHRSQVETAEDSRTKAGNSAPASLQLSMFNFQYNPPAALRATLRPYQLEGYRWLWRNMEARTGCCLSDEMGLGKTVQTIALLLGYKEASMAGTLPLPHRCSLVVAPSSVVHNWQGELGRFAPSLIVGNYTGDVAKRRAMRRAMHRWDVAITTYRTLVNDIDYIAKMQLGIAVFDESQAFKTATSQVHDAVCRVQALHHIALSGTPVENNLMELWSLMNVLNPSLLGHASDFQRSFIRPIAVLMEQERTELLQRIIAPYFLKRSKEQVLRDLPERQDEVVVCPMTDEQTTLYAEELSKARNEYLDTAADEPQRNLHILAAIQRLRQIANGEGKMSVVFERLEQLRQTRHKVLIFSEYVTLLQHVGERMAQQGWQYDLLTGQTRGRQQVIDHFQNTADCQFFLISLKAGGVGLNLTAADYVFILDPWWNQTAEEQAIARAHRIGQTRAVFVYRFVTENTLDQQILSLQERKQNLIDSVMPFICNEKAEQKR